jgi:hypothetical protein
MNPWDEDKISDYQAQDDWMEAERAERPPPPPVGADEFLMGPPPPDDGKGPWIRATFDSICPCGRPIFEGEKIRADGDGDWEGQDCCG